MKAMKSAVQTSLVTVTPLGREKSVTVSKCHSNHIILMYERPFEKRQSFHCKQDVTVTCVTVSREVCTRG